MTTEVVKELESLISLLEVRIPASPARNERLAKKLESDMAEYFRQIEMAFPIENLEQFYYRHVKQE